jgi:AraC family transcriptional regulator, ethanolamine operon transcriptional activator
MSHNFERTELEIFDQSLLKETVKGSFLSHMQIDCGVFEGRLMRVDLGSACIDYGHYNRRVIAQGELPKDRHTFGFLLQSPVETKIFKRTLPIGDMIFLPSGHEFGVFLSQNTQWICISFVKSFFENSFREIAGNSDVELPTRALLMTLPSNEKSTLCQLLETVVFQQEAPLVGQENPDSHDRLVEDLFLICGRTLTTSSQSKANWNNRSRLQLVGQIEEYFRLNNFARMKIPDICKLFNVSIRTLEYAFKETYGVTPLKYLNLQRLNAARQTLLESKKGTVTVTEIAMKAGFWHLSQFAGDYRSLFGETPSQTLHRSSSRNRLI